MAEHDMSVSGATEQAAESGWQTPMWLVEMIHLQFGPMGIDLDPCTTAANPCRARRFYFPPDYDGILWSWGGPAIGGRPWNIYCNPPYGRTIGMWMDKCLHAAADGARVIALVPAWTSTRWFQRTVNDPWALEVCFLKGRLDFNDIKMRGKFSSVLIGFNQQLDLFKTKGIVLRKAA